MASFVSHAQNREDVLLWRALNDVEQGRYIDLGAAEPVTDSVTYAFYQRGWSGINVEPVRTLFDQLQAERPRDINLNIGAGEATDERTLHELVGTGLSTFEGKAAARLARSVGCDTRTAQTQIRPMGEVCREYGFSTAHFLKIDVEGMEEQALRGFDFGYCRPWIVLVESTIPNSRVQRFRSWEPLLTRQGYDFAQFDGLNRFYLCEQHKDRMSRLSVPVNVFDGYRTAAEFFLARRAQDERQTKEALEASFEHERTKAEQRSQAEKQATAQARAEAEAQSRARDKAQAQARAHEAATVALRSEFEQALTAARAQHEQAEARAVASEAQAERADSRAAASDQRALAEQRERQSTQARLAEVEQQAARAEQAAQAAALAAADAAREAVQQAELTAQRHQSALQQQEQVSKAQRDQLQSRMEMEHRAAQEAKQLHRKLLDAHVALEAGYLQLQAQSKAQQHQLKASQTATRRAQDHSRQQKAKLVALEADLASLKDAYQALDANLHQALEQVTAQSRQAEWQDQELAGREQALRAADVRIERLRAELVESERQERARSQQLQWVYESRSWQITAPLRFVSRAVGASLRLLARMGFEALIFLTGPLLRPLIKRKSVFAFGVQLFNRAPALKSVVRDILARRGLLPGGVMASGGLPPVQPTAVSAVNATQATAEPVKSDEPMTERVVGQAPEPTIDAAVFARVRNRLGPVKSPS